MTGRTIPVTRTDGSEVASEATQELIKAKTDNLDIALSALRDALRGTGNKTLTDLWNELASTLAVQDSDANYTLANILTKLGQTLLVEAYSLPLPTGAATDAKLEAVRALLAGTLAVSAASLPLPSGAATSANQTTANTSLANILTALGLLATAAQLPVSLGSKTAAGSLSVTGSSDGVFYVGGVSADGQVPTNQGVRVAGMDAGGLKRTFRTDPNGAIVAVTQPDTTSSGTISALYVNDSTVGGSLKVAVPTGARSVTVWLNSGGNLNGTVQVKYVNSNGDQSPFIYGYLFASAAYIGSLSGAGSTAYSPIKFVIPPGTNYVIAVCNSYSSGSATINMSFSDDPCVDMVSGQVSVLSNTARMGSTFAPGIWYDDTSSALTANSTFTSTARDVTATASGSAFASGSTNAKEYRVMAEQDVAFTLQIQASRDNSAFRVVQSITATNISGGGYVAEASVAPKWRYYRYAIVNGGSNAARTTGGSILMAS